MKRVALIFAFFLLPFAFFAQVPSIGGQQSFIETLAGNGLLPDIISCWELDEPSGTVVYDANSLHNGTNAGCTVNQTGILDKCYDLENTEGDRIILANNADFRFGQSDHTDRAFSFSVWLNAESLPTTGRSIIAKGTTISGGHEYQSQVWTDGNLSFAVFDYSSTAKYLSVQLANPFTVGSWIHYVMTYDGSSTAAGIKFYINGVNQTLLDWSSGGYTGMPYNGTSALQFGRPPWTTGTYGWDGLMDQFAIWAKELSSEQVSTLYATGNGIFYTDYTAIIEQSIKTLWNSFYENINEIQTLKIAS